MKKYFLPCTQTFDLIPLLGLKHKKEKNIARINSATFIDGAYPPHQNVGGM